MYIYFTQARYIYSKLTVGCCWKWPILFIWQ